MHNEDNIFPFFNTYAIGQFERQNSDLKTLLQN